MLLPRGEGNGNTDGGQVLPSGGPAGWHLAKRTDADYDVEWVPPDGGSAGDLSHNELGGLQGGNQDYRIHFDDEEYAAARKVIDGGAISFPADGALLWPPGRSVTPPAGFEFADPSDIPDYNGIPWIVYTGGTTPSVVPVTGVTVFPTSQGLIGGETAQLAATVLPLNATNKAVSWASSNLSVATVSASGLVTAVGDGSATITATTSDGSFTANCSIVVAGTVIPVTGVSLSPTSADVKDGQGVDITVTITPVDAEDKSWRAEIINIIGDGVGIASVGPNRVTVQGYGEGEGTLRVTTTDGGFTATARVTTEWDT